MKFLSTNGKGLALCLAIAIPAWLLGQAFPIIGGPIIAILLGMLVTIPIKDKTNLAAGIKFTSKKILQWAVILLGFGLNLGVILETAADAISHGRDVDMAIEAVRAALGRTITRRFCEDGQLRVITLDAEVEKRIIASITRNEQGVYLAMGPDLMHQIVSQMAEHMKKFADLSQTPIILVSQVIRGYFSKMITQFYPNVYVLSFNEITSNVQIQALGNITLDAPIRMDRTTGVK